MSPAWVVPLGVAETAMMVASIPGAEAEDVTVPDGIAVSQAPLFATAASTASAAISAGGQLYVWGEAWLGAPSAKEPVRSPVPTAVQGFPEGAVVADVAMSDSHIVAVTSDGAGALTLSHAPVTPSPPPCS